MPGADCAAPSSHVALLSNYARTVSYREVLARHVQDKVVAEIGCGSGVLACFAAKTGARRVYAIERTSIVHIAQQIASANGLSDRIVFVPGSSFDVELPERADIVYAELIGSDPLVQDVLVVYADARQRFLTADGRMIPQQLAINAVCVESAVVARSQYMAQQSIRKAKSLGSLYGLDLAPLVEAYEQEMRTAGDSYAPVESIGGMLPNDQAQPSTKFLTDEVEVVRFDLGRDAHEQCLHVPLVFEATVAGTHNAVAVSFTVQLDEGIVLSTSPFSAQLLPSWAQIIRPVAQAAVRRGDTIELEAVVGPRQRPSVSFRRSGP